MGIAPFPSISPSSPYSSPSYSTFLLRRGVGSYPAKCGRGV